jgi:HAD superfamily hydrolase (TIGR01509 family)
MTLKALLWDVDGTLAETERDGHRVAFNQVFEACGVPWRWSIERYGELLNVTGGRERLLHDMSTRTDAPTTSAERDDLARRIHQAKNQRYAAIVAAGGIPLRPGVREVLDECRRRDVRMAIATTTSRSNVEALLRAQLGASWADRFEFAVCGEDVATKKPHPEVYLQALHHLGLDPLETLAIEDSPGGVAAARAADVPVIVTRSVYFATATIDAVVAVGPGFDQRKGWHPALVSRTPDQRVTLDDLIDWHQRMDFVSHVA